MLKQTQIERVFPSVSLTKGSLSPQGNCVGQGNIKWTLLSKNKCFWRSLDILNIALHWPGQLPSDARTRSRWQHYLLELDLFLCPETTHKEPGTGNGYWVLQVFPGHCLRPDRNETTVGKHTKGAKRIVLWDLHYCSHFAIKNIKSKEQWLALWPKTLPGETAFPGKGEEKTEEKQQEEFLFKNLDRHPWCLPSADAPSRSPTGLLHASSPAGSFCAHLWNWEWFTPLSFTLFHSSSVPNVLGT